MIMNVNDENWKAELIELVIQSINAGAWDQRKLYEQIGCYYMTKAPASIFKYYSPNNLNIEAVDNNKMWYSAACNFNDPFDMEIFFDEKKMFNSLLDSVPEAKGVREGSIAWKNAKEAFDKNLKEFKSSFEQIRTNMGISCFSEKEDSILMWSHYADNHKGFCVEYQLMEFSEQLKFTPVPVIYGEQKACMNSFDLQNLGPDVMRLFIQAVTRKSLEWQYENEWRIVRDNGSCGTKWDSDKKGALLESIKPASIIIGCNASKETTERLEKYCRTDKIPLRKMEKDKIEYKLVEIPISVY